MTTDDDYATGYRDGLARAAEAVAIMWDAYTTPAARAALGAAMDRLRELAAEGADRP
jgi:hypothetical protein